MYRTRLTSLILFSALVSACSDSPTGLDNSLKPSFSSTGSSSFSESFESGTLSPNGKLEATDPSAISYANGAVVFDGYTRSYLRTVAANYANTNFTAEVTVTVPDGMGGGGIAYFGLGAGMANCNYYCEPATAPSIYARLMPNDFWSSTQITTVTPDALVEQEGSRAWGTGSGTHRVRITWDAATRSFTVAVHTNYVDGPFVPTHVAGPEYMPAGLLADGNARIFFGGASGVAFHNLKIVAQPAK